ncbi:MAG: hypothetical protein WCB62_00830, partial [Pseudolabrys sp.]
MRFSVSSYGFDGASEHRQASFATTLASREAHQCPLLAQSGHYFLGHLVLYETNDRCDNRPSDAAANCLTEESTNIHA